MYRTSINPAGAKRIIADARERRRKAIVFVMGPAGVGRAQWSHDATLSIVETLGVSAIDQVEKAWRAFPRESRRPPS